MAVADVIALVLVIGILGIGGRSILSAWTLASERRKEADLSARRMRDDLRTALDSHDRGKLEDFLVLWGDKLDAKARAHIQTRMDDLLLEKEL
jgi:hypothetical protein